MYMLSYVAWLSFRIRLMKHAERVTEKTSYSLVWFEFTYRGGFSLPALAYLRWKTSWISKGRDNRGTAFVPFLPANKYLAGQGGKKTKKKYFKRVLQWACPSSFRLLKQKEKTGGRGGKGGTKMDMEVERGGEKDGGRTRERGEKI